MDFHDDTNHARVTQNVTHLENSITKSVKTPTLRQMPNFATYIEVKISNTSSSKSFGTLKLALFHPCKKSTSLITINSLLFFLQCKAIGFSTVKLIFQKICRRESLVNLFLVLKREKKNLPYARIGSRTRNSVILGSRMRAP